MGARQALPTGGRPSPPRNKGHNMAQGPAVNPLRAGAGAVLTVTTAMEHVLPQKPVSWLYLLSRGHAESLDEGTAVPSQSS